MVFNVFRKGYFQCLQELDDLSPRIRLFISSRILWKALELDSPAATLSEDLFSERSTQGRGTTSRILLAQVKAGNGSTNLFNEIRKLVYSLYWKKESKKVYNNLLG